jgi:hypothetical protein
MNTCLIICNGTGLKDIPNDFLAKFDTFGSNRIYLRYVPDYYACINAKVLDQYGAEIENIKGCHKFIADTHKIKGAVPLHNEQRLFFAHSPLDTISEHWTVTYTLLQLAFHFGYRRVGLVGCDHYYGETDGTKRVIEGEDKYHFSADYFKYAKWEAPNLRESERAYRLAKVEYEAAGGEIINLSTFTKLDIFKQESWRSWQQ